MEISIWDSEHRKLKFATRVTRIDTKVLRIISRYIEKTKLEERIDEERERLKLEWQEKMTKLKNELWKTERKVQELQAQLSDIPCESGSRKELLTKVEEYSAEKSLQVMFLMAFFFILPRRIQELPKHGCLQWWAL